MSVTVALRRSQEPREMLSTCANPRIARRASDAYNRLVTRDSTPSTPVILGIESSCDDTACSIVDGNGRVLSSIVSSQLAAHRPFGGVVPEVASREHLVQWPAVSGRALEDAGVTLEQVDAIAATQGPGLIGSLLVGLSLGRSLAYGRGVPFYAVHHLEAHLYSPFLSDDGSPAEAPVENFLGLVVSGGHTSLYRVQSGAVSTLAETRDDAIGEAFDKVGKRIGLPYPQGPRVDELAEAGDERRFELPLPKLSDQSLDFSYSGLKSETVRRIEQLERDGEAIRIDEDKAAPQLALDLLASFRRAAVRQILSRLDRIRKRSSLGTLAVSGGVAANRLLRKELEGWAAEHDVDLRLVPLRFCGDNAAMIAHAALLRHQRGDGGDDPRSVGASSRLPIPGSIEAHEIR